MGGSEGGGPEASGERAFAAPQRPIATGFVAANRRCYRQYPYSRYRMTSDS